MTDTSILQELIKTRSSPYLEDNGPLYRLEENGPPLRRDSLIYAHSGFIEIFWWGWLPEWARMGMGKMVKNFPNCLSISYYIN